MNEYFRKIKRYLFILIASFCWGACGSEPQAETPNPPKKTSYRPAFEQFIEKINAHEVKAMGELFSDDHVFIDAQDKKLEGKQRLIEGWEAYFTLFPDYQINIEEIIEKDSTVIGFGKASGTYMGMTSELNENRWEIPAVWRAEIAKGKIKQFRIYCDTKIIYEIIKSNQPSSDF
ncbi:MAG: nuclear transport factor 2 family protein [Bacteroidia bacterium]